MVGDIEKAIEFYQKWVGLKLVNHLHLEMGQIVFLSNGKNETMLELIQFKDAEKVSMSGIVMSYSTDEKFDALRERALHLGYSPTKIICHSTKSDYFRLLDSDGITVEFSI